MGSFCWRRGGAESKERQVRGSEKAYTPPSRVAPQKEAREVLRPGTLGGWLCSSGTLQSQLPQCWKHLPRPFPSNSTPPRTQKALGQRQMSLPLRMPTSTRLPTPRPCQLPCCLAKPVHPACWDKFLGRQHSLQVRYVRAGRTALYLCSSPRSSNTRAGQSAASFGGSSRCVWEGRRAGVPQELSSKQIPHLTFPRTWWGAFARLILSGNSFY